MRRPRKKQCYRASTRGRAEYRGCPGCRRCWRLLLCRIYSVSTTRHLVSWKQGSQNKNGSREAQDAEAVVGYNGDEGAALWISKNGCVLGSTWSHFPQASPDTSQSSPLLYTVSYRPSHCTADCLLFDTHRLLSNAHQDPRIIRRCAPHYKCSAVHPDEYWQLVRLRQAHPSGRVDIEVETVFLIRGAGATCERVGWLKTGGDSRGSVKGGRGPVGWGGVFPA